MLIFVLQEIFRITKKKRKKNFGENLSHTRFRINFYEKFQFFLTMSISHIVILGPEKLKVLSVLFFNIDLREHKKNPFRILQSYLSIKLREQKKLFGMLQPYFSMGLREQKKTHLEFYNVYSCISTATYMYINTKWSRSVLHVLLMYF